MSEETREKFRITSTGRKHSQETKDKLSKIHIGMGHTDETKEKIRQIRIGTKATEEAKKNIRKGYIKRMHKQLGEGGQMVPFFNLDSCKYFEWFDKYIFESKGQYGTNGREFYCKEVGCWIDYINHDNKTIIEWDEEYHFKNNKLSAKDIQRQKEIEAVFPDYDFIRIRESQLNYFMLCLLVVMRYKNQLKE